MTDFKRHSTRDAIIEAAFAVFSRDPSAPLSDVAEAAGVGRATLHRQFSGRGELIRALALIALEEMDKVAEEACADTQTYAEAFESLIAAFIPLGSRHGFLALEPFSDDAEIKTEYERQDRETALMVEGAKQEGLFDPAVPTSWIITVFNTLLYAAWDSVRAGQTTQAQAADLTWRSLTTGLGPKE